MPMDESGTIHRVNEAVAAPPAVAHTRYDVLLRMSRAVSGFRTPEELLRMVADELATILQFQKLYDPAILG